MNATGPTGPTRPTGATGPSRTARRPGAAVRPPGSRDPGAVQQVRALLRMRVAALRERPRRGVVLGLALIPGLVIGTVIGCTLLPPTGVPTVQVFVPTAWLFFGLAAVIAASAGAGGRQLLPREQAAVFPITPAADQLGAVLLAPLNMAWLAQCLALLGLTSWVAGPHLAVLPAQGITLVWIVAATVAAQAFGWLIELLRTVRVGVWLVRAAAVGLVLLLGMLAATGRVTALLQAMPTQRFGIAAARTAKGLPAPVLADAAELLLATVIAWWIGVRLVTVLHRRPQLLQNRAEARGYRRRRRAAAGPLAAALRVDHASVWRSAPLRRGLITLAVIPGATAALAGLSWPMVALLPGLVASGAGLLFGVNAFALDGPGALWRETLPGTPRALLLARIVVTVEACMAGAVLAVVSATVRAPGPPTAEAALALAGAVIATTAQVVSLCIGWSVQRPYAAALRDSRDQPAPPVAMAGYSARLALATTLTGLLYAGLARFPAPELVIFLTLAIVLFAARRLVRVTRCWDDAEVRARVLTTVAGIGG